MKTQKQMWKDINEPKVEKLITLFDESGKPIAIGELLDRIPIWYIEEGRNKK